MKIGVSGPFLLSSFGPELGVTRAELKSLPSGLGGTQLVHLVRELLERDYEVVVFTLDRSIPVGTEVILNGDKLKVCVGPYRERHRARDFFHTERHYLRSAIEREAPDVVHAHWTYEFALAALDSKVPTLITARDAPFSILRFNLSPYRAVRTAMAIAVARRAKHMTAISPYVAKHFQRFLRYRGAITIVPNGFSLISVEGGRSEACERPLTLGSIANGWGGRKNTKAAIRAFNGFHRSNPKSRLLLIGVGHELDGPAHHWSKHQGMEEGIVFMGELPYQQLLTILHTEIDILIHPAVEEAFGNTIIESMAAGIPVITGRGVAGPEFIIDDGRTGVLVDVRNPERIQDAIDHLARNVELRKSLGQNARETVEARFSIASVTDQFVEGYRRVIGSPNE